MEQATAKVAELESKLEEALKVGLDDDSKTKLEALAAENKTLIEARDKAKQKAKAEEEEKLKAQGEYKTVAEQKEAELAEAQAKLDELNGKVKGFEDAARAELATILETVAEEDKALISDGLPLATQILMAKRLSTAKQGPPKGRIPGEPETETLEAQYAEAVKNKDTATAMVLKRKIFEKQKT